jgi:hypothetical protein
MVRVFQRASFGARDRHWVSEAAFGVGSGLERVTTRSPRGGVADAAGIWLVRRETRGEIVGLAEVLGDGAGLGITFGRPTSRRAPVPAAARSQPVRRLYIIYCCVALCPFRPGLTSVRSEVP